MAVYDARFDLNKDGKIDEADEAILTAALHSHDDRPAFGGVASPNWNPDCDFNKSGVVDISDWTTFATYMSMQMEEGAEATPSAVPKATPNIAFLVLLAIVLIGAATKGKRR